MWGLTPRFPHGTLPRARTSQDRPTQPSVLFRTLRCVSTGGGVRCLREPSQLYPVIHPAGDRTFFPTARTPSARSYDAEGKGLTLNLYEVR